MSVPPKIGDDDRSCLGLCNCLECLAVLVSILLVVLDTVGLFF